MDRKVKVKHRGKGVVAEFTIQVPDTLSQAVSLYGEEATLSLIKEAVEHKARIVAYNMLSYEHPVQAVVTRMEEEWSPGKRLRKSTVSLAGVSEEVKKDVL